MNRIFWILLFTPFCAFAQFSNSTISLSGTWNFAIDSTRVGENSGWVNKTLTDKIVLPGTTDDAGYGDEFVETGRLSRLHKYVGLAWYQTDVDIPKEWKGRNVELFLEVVKWRSKLWIDGKYIDLQESLSTPHIYSLGVLSPGKHRVVLQIDNSEIYPIGNERSHSYGIETQTIWNGVLGRIELRSHVDVWLEMVRTFSSAEGDLSMEFSLKNNTLKVQKADIKAVVKDKSNGKVVSEIVFPFEIPVGGNVVKRSVKIENVKTWDEFSPNLYTLESSVKSKSGVDTPEITTFGFRTISTTPDYIVVNGTPRFMRGNLDCAVFPLTGYPATDKESWLKICQAYKDYGFNHIRFHSWTPPRAAFDAADEVGLYALSEIFWRDGWMGKGLDVEACEPFLRPELRRIVDTYGNAPSLVMVAMGNEMGGFDIKKFDPWIAEVKEHDSRHLYAASVRRPATAHADVNYQGDLSSPYPLMMIDEGRLSSDWDYAAWYGDASPLPSIQHELGQWTFYPQWDHVKKYNGLLRARGLEKYMELAKQNGVFEQNEEFVQSSGKQSLMLYKENIESILRTPRCGGLQILGMQDFTGQGEALIGWLDPFYDSKGVVMPERFRNWHSSTVPLMRTSKYIYDNSEKLVADIEILRFELEDMRSDVRWKLHDKSGVVFDSGVFEKCDIKNGALNKIGRVESQLSKINQAKHLILEVSVDGTSFKNDWNFWVFPAVQSNIVCKEIIETNSLSEAVTALKKGESVFLWAYGLGSALSSGYSSWKPTFWTAGYSGNDSHVNGAVVRHKHPALAKFPTEDYLDFQWFDICNGSRGFNLKGLPSNVLPIVQPISDFHFNNKLGSIVELCSEEGGKILICGYNLIDNKNAAAVALKNSLMDYVGSAAFNPAQKVDYKWMESQLSDPKVPIVAPLEFGDAILYVKAGVNAYQSGVNKWSVEQDGATSYDPTKYGFKLGKGSIVYNSSYSAWQGKELEVEIKMPFNYEGRVMLHIINHSNKPLDGTVLFDGKEQLLGGVPESGKWISFKMKSGDALFGNVKVVFKANDGGVISVDELVLIE